jgi:hypothetical protein
MRRTLSSLLILSLTILPTVPTFAGEARGGASMRSTGEGGGGGTGGGAGGGGRGSDPGPGRADKNTDKPTPNMPSPQIHGENLGFSAPDPPKPDKPTPPKEKPPTKVAEGRATSVASMRGGRVVVVSATTHPSDHPDKANTQSDAVKVASKACPFAAPAATPAGIQPNAEQSYAEQLQAIQQAAVAVNARYKSNWPRPRCQKPKKETSKNVTNWKDVAKLAVAAIRNPSSPLVRAQVLGKALAPATLGTSADLVWVDGPYPEEVELIQRVKDLQKAKPAKERAAELNRWLEEKLWEATHTPYIAAPRPL